MYRDNTLIPSEAVRLAALGILADGEKTYAALASEVRHFTGHVVGPSLELIGQPLELLKLEGLVESSQGEGSDEDAIILQITQDGRQELCRLMAANLRPPVNDLSKLIIALKMRFLHLLEPAEQRLQAESMVAMVEREQTRLIALREHHAGSDGYFLDWLDQDLTAIRSRLDWFRRLAAQLEQG